MSVDKKNLHELSVDDLVQLAQENPPPSTEDEKVTEASQFIYALNIRHGDHKVSAELIYHTFKEWKGLYQKKWQPPAYFFRDFKKYFTSVRGKHGVSYLLDPTPFDLSRENYFLVRYQQRREKAYSKAEKTKKKRRKKRRSNQKV